MTTAIKLSTNQIAHLAAILMGINRPVQSLNGRTVMTEAVW